ncbi:4Fe-4S dicluster domain-containing protein [Desulforhopalus singaporensis]|uniref:4Fe-4S dicluster domain-containing protein n=1 Tax=Desulforhopalus singaporensis TaxID=91360 RepID=UPI0015A269C4|nr:4Fe-4S dicluster domain-containing protein [Desulforhopalus singaporensis]
MEQEPYVITIDYTRCSGCRVCELACSLSHYQECSSNLSRIRLVEVTVAGVVAAAPTLCQNCCDPPCEKICPTGATRRDPESNLMTVAEELCIGCKGCVHGCPFGATAINPYRDAAFRCDQCGGFPVCVEVCPENVLSYWPLSVVSNRLRRKRKKMSANFSLPAPTVL